MQEMQARSLGQVEKEMTTHSRILAWEIPWTEESGGLQAMEMHRGRLYFSLNNKEMIKVYGGCAKG